MLGSQQSVVEADDDAEDVSLRSGVTKDISELIGATYVLWKDTPQQSVSGRSVKQYMTVHRAILECSPCRGLDWTGRPLLSRAARKRTVRAPCRIQKPG